MAEIVLAVLLVISSVERVLAGRAWSSEQRALVNRIIARTPSDVAMLDRDPVPRTFHEDNPMASLDGFDGIIGLGG